MYVFVKFVNPCELIVNTCHKKKKLRTVRGIETEVVEAGPDGASDRILVPLLVVVLVLLPRDDAGALVLRGSLHIQRDAVQLAQQHEVLVLSGGCTFESFFFIKKIFFFN